MSGCEFDPRAEADRRTTETSEPSARALVFLAYLVREFGEVGTLTPAFAAGSIMGYVFRTHVDECHPADVDTALELMLPTVAEEVRDGYRAGYGFDYRRELLRGA
jgi:hypothetical protein